MKRKLTTKFIEGQKPNPSKRLDFRDELMSGLVLRISTSGTKTFCLHKRINGKMRRLKAILEQRRSFLIPERYPRANNCRPRIYRVVACL
jgi:hypothetical protein